MNKPKTDIAVNFNHILLILNAPGASIISSALNQLQSAIFIAIRFLRYTTFGVIHSKKPNLFHFHCKITILAKFEPLHKPVLPYEEFFMVSLPPNCYLLVT